MKTINSKLLSKTFHITIIALLFCVSYSYAQSKSTSIQVVNRIQDIQFGTFVLTGSQGGTVSVSKDGIRTSTGSIALLGNGFQPAIFEVIVDGNLNNISKMNLTISYGPCILTGPDGGSLTLLFDPQAIPFVGTYSPTNINNNEYKTTLTVGGKLAIPGNAISDTYTGTFIISIDNQ